MAYLEELLPEFRKGAKIRLNSLYLMASLMDLGEQI